MMNNLTQTANKYPHIFMKLNSMKISAQKANYITALINERAPCKYTRTDRRSAQGLHPLCAQELIHYVNELNADRDFKLHVSKVVN